MEGLIKEKKSFSKEKPSEDILGFYNLHAAQKVERYEITSDELARSRPRSTWAWTSERWTCCSRTSRKEECTLDLLKQLASDYEVEQDDGEEAEQEEARGGTSAGDHRRPEALGLVVAPASRPALPRPRVVRPVLECRASLADNGRASQEALRQVPFEQ